MHAIDRTAVRTAGATTATGARGRPSDVATIKTVANPTPSDTTEPIELEPNEAYGCLDPTFAGRHTVRSAAMAISDSVTSTLDSEREAGLVASLRRSGRCVVALLTSQSCISLHDATRNRASTLHSDIRALHRFVSEVLPAAAPEIVSTETFQLAEVVKSSWEWGEWFDDESEKRAAEKAE